MFSVITALFLIGEYEDQRHARIIRSWQFLNQTQDQARTIVCEAQRSALDLDHNCNPPPPLPSFVGTQELTCTAFREANILDKEDQCIGRTIVTLAVAHGADKICEILETKNLLRAKDPCKLPNLIIMNGIAQTLPQHTAARQAMRSLSGQLTVVQSLFESRQPTQGLQLPWSNLAYIVARRSQNLSVTNFSGGILIGANLADTVMGGQVTAQSGTGYDRKVKETYTGGANLAGAILDSANLSHTALGGAILADAILNRTNLSQANLRRAVMSHSYLWDTKFTGADLSYADLFEAEFRKADLSDTILRCADLTGASLNGVVGLTQSQLDMAIAHPKRPPDIFNSADKTTGRALKWKNNSKTRCKGARVIVRDW